MLSPSVGLSAVVNGFDVPSVGCRIAGGACVPSLQASKQARVAQLVERELRFKAAFDAFEGDVDPLWLAQKERTTVRVLEKVRERRAERRP